MKTKRKWPLWAAIGAGVLALALCLLPKQTLPGWAPPQNLPAAQEKAVRKELFQIAQVCADAGSEPKSMENALLEAGYATVVTEENYPEYLGNPESLYAFWEAACGGKDAAQTLVRPDGEGGFWHTRLFQEKGEQGGLITRVVWENGQARVAECELLPLYEMELADWGIFYYRLYPANDPHYIDYSQLRLAPVDRELYDLNRKYILPVGYQMVNLFLCDWQEGSWGSVSFNDLFEFFYQQNTGDPFPWNDTDSMLTSTQILIPAELFEETVLPHFQISLPEFRQRCGYDASREGYPWRPTYGNDLVTWHFPMCEPEVLNQTQNGDGTFTLSVQVASPELKTDRLFSHQVTIRPLADGAYQYVENHVTDSGSHGLPYNGARFDLDP